jgi:hypothetical protein
MHAIHATNARTSHANSMDHDAQIEAAITDLEPEEGRSYTATAKKWNINRSALSQHHRGKTRLNQVRPPIAYRYTEKDAY